MEGAFQAGHSWAVLGWLQHGFHRELYAVHLQSPSSGHVIDLQLRAMREKGEAFGKASLNIFSEQLTLATHGHGEMLPAGNSARSTNRLARQVPRLGGRWEL